MQNNRNRSNIEKLKSSHINPYNFVPIGQKCIKAPYQSGSLTGKIHCTLTPKSDFFIPNTSNDMCKWEYNKNPKHKVEEFFSYDNLPENHEINSNNFPDKPVIPGSELRGMVRSMYETFTDSCLSAFENEKQLSSRTSENKSPGLLVFHNGEWSLFKAIAYKLNFDDKADKLGYIFKRTENQIFDSYGNKYDTFSKVRFDSVIVKKKNKRDQDIKVDTVKNFGYNGSKIGYLIIGERLEFNNGKRLKKADNIIYNPVVTELLSNGFDYEKAKQAVEKINGPDFKQYEKEHLSKEIVKKAVNNYNEIIRNYYNNYVVNKNAVKDSSKLKFYRNSIIEELEDTVFPVWYRYVDSEHLYISPSCIGRNIYMNKLKDFIGNYLPCTCKNEVCEACSIFGFVGGNNNGDVLASSLRFSDAKFKGEKNPVYQKITTIKELSSPKISSMEMYTHLIDGIDADFWTYDFSLKNSKYRVINPGDIVLNGRKFYFHDLDDNISKYKAKPYKGIIQNERNSTIRPLRGISVNKFEFDVYFEKITNDQLKKLLVVLSMRGNKSKYAYKLGMGKPIGLGSVKIEVNDVYIREINNETLESSLVLRTQDYIEYFTTDKMSEFRVYGDEKVMDAINALTSMTFVKSSGKISYPRSEDKYGNEAAGYQWFMNNRGNPTFPKYDQKLYDASGRELIDTKKIK